MSGLLGQSGCCLGEIKVGIFQINSIHDRSKIINYVISSFFQSIKISKHKKISFYKYDKFINYTGNKINPNFVLSGRIEVGACEKG